MIHADVGCRLHSRRRVAQAELEALEAQNDRPYLRSVFRAADMDMVGGSRKNRLDAPLRRTEANHARFKYLIIETKATGKQLEQFCTNTCGTLQCKRKTTWNMEGRRGSVGRKKNCPPQLVGEI